jgi:histidinol-phosphatase (PHP family)
MRYYDQNVHTDFSFDSKTKMADYMPVAGASFVSTERIEYRDPSNQKQDRMLDYTGYVAEIERLKKSTGKQIYKGVELGMAPGAGEELAAYLAHHPFDLRLLSFHHDEKKDFNEANVTHMDPIKVTEDYYDLMWQGIKEFHDADVLAHFDYGVRNLSLTIGQFATTAGVMLTQIFKVAIENGMALELNTKSMYECRNVALYEYAIEIYKQLGGQKFTIGSDATDPKDYNRYAKEAMKCLQAHDIHQVTMVDGQVAIDEIMEVL